MLDGGLEFQIRGLFLYNYISVIAQPPPPDIPTTEQPVIIDPKPPKPTTPNVPITETGNEVPPLPPCPDMICTLEFIPEHCRITPVHEINGMKCSGCPQWNDSCKTLPKETKDNLKTEIQCPNKTCTENILQKKCAYVETFDYKGRICEKCPVYIPGCVPDEMSSATDTQCPVQACTLELIPDECREIPTFAHHGLQCKGCPRWRPGCENKPQVACPLAVCDSYIPSECQVKREYEFRGQICTSCPSWREGCREEERLKAININITPSLRRDPFNTPPTPCLKFPCVDNNIPTECRIEQPYQFRGRTCFRCPVRSPTCTSNFPGNTRPEQPCPILKCDSSADVPQECFRREFYRRNGKLCEGCPSIIPGCTSIQIIPPRPNVPIIPDISERIIGPEIACPLLRCESLSVPPECLETPMFSHGSKMCRGCPRQKEGCIPTSSSQMTLNPGTEFPQIPAEKPDTSCPVKACPMIYIPPECKEDQPYQYHGKTCYDCPKQKQSCITINAQSSIQTGNIQQMSCPMFGCPYILIPPECRVERPFQFQGRTCYMCPLWREGCVPLPPKPDVIYPPAEPLTTTQSSVSKPSGPNNSEIECPLLPCTKILIPKQCREETPYDFNGKTCYKCPKWKAGCPERGNAETTTANSLESTSSLLKQKDSPSLTDLKGVLPVNRIIDTVRAVTCPTLRCPAMFIPPTCREESVYQFQDRTCQGCPTWRLGCNPMSGSPMNMNANG